MQGTVVSISPDARGDQPLPVLPGMTGQVEIRTGERSVLGFPLRSMMKSQ